jgi:dipeptidyl-peptidase-4
MLKVTFLLTFAAAFISNLAQAQDAGKKPVTLDAVLAERRGSSVFPIWAPGGQTFAYHDQGKIALYNVAAKSSSHWFNPSDLAKAAVKPAETEKFGWQNRRVSSDSYQWSSDGKDLLASVDGDLFMVKLNGKFQHLTRTEFEEEDPKLSPDSKQILYRSQSNLFLLDVKSKKVRQLTTDGSATILNGQLDWVYPEELDLSTATWWSPDSKQIAFLRFDVGKEFVYPQTDLLGERAISEPERYPQTGTANANVQLGVIDLQTGVTKWMKIGETANTLIARVYWLPDSSTVVTERLSRVQDKLELLFCNPSDGETRTVLTEHSKTWINFADNFYPLKSRPEFLWTSEASGFRHIYRYSNKGEMLGQLTKGDWEVRSVAAIDEATQKIYFTSSEASPLQTQLYSVGFEGGARTRLTQEEGTHNIHANESGSAFVDSFSNFKAPSQTLLKDSAGRQLAVLRPPDTKPQQEFDILPTEVVEVKTADGVTLYGLLIKPAGYQSGKKYPLIVDVYGGPGVQIVRNEWHGVNWMQFMAHKGYAVWMMDNRGSSGRGHAFEDPIYRDLGTTEVADQVLGVQHLIDLGLVDAQRIGITGGSYGGYMTLHSMLLAPGIFKVGVADAPVTDWHNYDTIYTERYMGLPDKNAERYRTTSNVQNAAKLQGHLLLVHNFEDDNVLFQNTMQMANALEKADKQFFMQIYPLKQHGVSGSLRRPLMQTMTAFFDQYLQPGT